MALEATQNGLLKYNVLSPFPSAMGWYFLLLLCGRLVREGCQEKGHCVRFGVRYPVKEICIRTTEALLLRAHVAEGNSGRLLPAQWPLQRETKVRWWTSTVERGDIREALRGAERLWKQEPCASAGCLCKKRREQLYIWRRLRGVPKTARCRTKRGQASWRVPKSSS